MVDARPFPSDFFLRPTVEVAQALLGALLVHDTPGGRLIGRIVETEAYLHNDPACHGVRELPGGGVIHKKTPRNATMFGPAGHAYVYFTYGNHFMLNVVTQPEGIPEAVLIRALEPMEGIETMMQLRGMGDLRMLTNGPGKLTRALAIDRAFDGHDVAQSPLRLLQSKPVPAERIVTTTRIGISRAVECPWRFYERENAWVSKR